MNVWSLVEDGETGEILLMGDNSWSIERWRSSDFRAALASALEKFEQTDYCQRNSGRAVCSYSVDTDTWKIADAYDN